MKKTILFVLCVVTCLLLAMSVMADTQAPTTCHACNAQKTWTVMPESWKTLTEGHYHYYLDKNVTPGQLITPSDVNVTICLDLNGYSIETNGRAMSLNSGTVLNLMDSSAGETGAVCGTTGSNNTASGTIAMKKGCQFNLYSGTVKFSKDDVGLGMCRGVVGIESGSQMQMFGGKVEGCELVTGTLTNQGTGGAIYMGANCQLTVSGGEITSGIVPESGEGPCVYASSGTSRITLTGNARVEEICGVSLQDNLMITGTYTGYARLRSVKAAPPSVGIAVGTAAGADISNANLFCTNDGGYAVNKSGDALVLAVFTPTAKQHKCDHCQDIMIWTSYQDGQSLLTQTGHHHLYLSEKYTGKQINPVADAQLCLDLYGEDIYSDGRALHLKDNAVISVMDTVGGSTVTGTSANSNPAGGVVAVNKNAQLNIYGGAFSAVQDGSGHGIGSGGVIYMGGAGEINLYGGSIQGTNLVISGYSLATNGYGAAVFVGKNGVLNVSGGEILSGSVPEGGRGECVYLHDATAKVKLSGNGSIEEIYCLDNDQQLTVTGNYTGTASLRFPDTVVIQENTVVGACVDADVTKAKLQCVNGSGYALVNKDGDLVTSSFGLDAVAAAFNPDGAAGYDTLQKAIDACNGGYVKLLQAAQQTATVEKDLYIDTNGYGATLTLAEGVTLYGFDSQTDDYTVSDGNYGKLTVTGGTVKGLPVESEFAQDQYLAVTEGDKVSFHRVTLQIYAMSLRPEKAGLYYKSHFLSDQVAAPKIASYGVALSVMDTPNAKNLETQCKYTTFTNFESGADGNPDTVCSTILTGVLKDKNSNKINTRNLNTTVYGRAYARTTDGALLLGQPVERSLKEQLELASNMLEKLTTQQVDGFAAMYQKYESVLEGLQLDNLRRIMDLTDTFVSADLIVDGKTEYVIVHDGTSGAKKLATQLVKIFVDVYGITLKSYAAEEREETAGEIVVGMSRWIAHKAARKLTGEFDFAMLPEEGKLLLCAKDELSYGYLGQYLKREVFVKSESADLTLDSDDELVYSQSELMDTTYVDYWMAGNTSFTLGDHFAYRTFTNEDTTLPYRIYVPFNYNPEKEYPLLLNLHGAGLRGNNNVRQLALIDKMMKIPEMMVDEAILVFPQCPENEKWVDTPWGEGSYDLDSVPESNELKAVMELIGQLQKDYSVDAKRIYAIGFSMGGYGTWNLLMNHPDVFAAGIPMCGAGDPSKAGVLKDMPIWAVHGAKDPTVPVSGSRDMAKAMEAVGATNFHYTEIADAEHDVWNYTYSNTEMFTWLFNQKKAG